MGLRPERRVVRTRSRRAAPGPQARRDRACPQVAARFPSARVPGGDRRRTRARRAHRQPRPSGRRPAGRRLPVRPGGRSARVGAGGRPRRGHRSAQPRRRGAQRAGGRGRRSRAAQAPLGGRDAGGGEVVGRHGGASSRRPGHQHRRLPQTGQGRRLVGVRRRRGRARDLPRSRPHRPRGPRLRRGGARPAPARRAHLRRAGPHPHGPGGREPQRERGRSSVRLRGSPPARRRGIFRRRHSASGAP